MVAELNWDKRVGENIRRLRKAAGMSQEALAYSSEVDVRYIGGIERGQENPSLNVLVNIAASLDVNPADLLA